MRSFTAPPLRFMYCWGLTTVTGRPAAFPSPRSIPLSRRHPEKRWSFAASASTAQKPALWRVGSYSEPGFPRPTTTATSLTFLALGALFLLLLHELRLRRRAFLGRLRLL